ncbi:MAG: sugar ABC transporter ATP-binding protein [Faecalicatena sp.]|nr:sugar ABC transporter ATP-binding protein [Faecalicatena sp.]MCI6464078.1 sugar ABC transporter ATP-binding protein [Faecalicatena sp.]
MCEFALEMLGITKEFPGVKALNNVTLRVKKGTIHAIVGENGAGKSTLMKVLNGVYQAESGEILIAGKKVSITDINKAQNLGISLIFQETNMIPQLSVTENFFLGHVKCKKGGVVDWQGMQEAVKKVFDELGYTINPRCLVSEISAAEKQMVEIARAISKNADIIVMDEPTSSLTSDETERLLDIVRKLKTQGKTIIYISHKLEEIFAISDMISVQRDGEIIDTKPASEMTTEEVIEKMVGRSVQTEYPVRNTTPGEVILKVESVSRKKLVQDVSLELHKGEVLGLAGLVGAGRTEFAETIFGAAKMTEGTILIHGKAVKIRNTKAATRASIGMLTEDRKETGLALKASIKHNIVISNLKGICSAGFWTNSKKENDAAKKYIGQLKIQTPSVNQTAVNLSGGNQQKVIIAKWLFSDVDILIMDEPTRGIDVGAKYEIYCLINELVAQGKSIILISSELPELIGMSDRVIIMHEGRQKGELSKAEMTPEAIMRLAVS